MNSLHKRLMALSAADRWHALVWLADNYPDAVAHMLARVPPAPRRPVAVRGEVTGSYYHPRASAPGTPGTGGGTR